MLHHSKPGNPSRNIHRRLAVSRTRLIISIVLLVLVIWVLFLVQTHYIEHYEVIGRSMAPTLLSGDRLLIRRGVAQYHRGDIVALNRPDRPVVNLVKRIVAMHPDRVRVHEGVVFVNGTKLNPPHAFKPGGSFPERRLRLEADQVFVLGDNPPDSVDSRTFGPVPLALLKGRVIYRIWPPQRRGPVE